MKLLDMGCILASMRESLQNKDKASMGVIPLTSRSLSIYVIFTIKGPFGQCIAKGAK
ncbi:hypothetical protein GCM10011391_38430 [Pullulanibacillus camelliae]|uniref:Uncharacterized protein n=1 Tax=Pullulanibacillus camelliae TaxID=1707096 RepID=A0A8J2YP03_9BACL|nr:hypothetical protein GCM10011391_38430 [Pullulanibacillus camelliae]